MKDLISRGKELKAKLDLFILKIKKSITKKIFKFSVVMTIIFAALFLLKFVLKPLASEEVYAIYKNIASSVFVLLAWGYVICLIDVVLAFIKKMFLKMWSKGKKKKRDEDVTDKENDGVKKADTDAVDEETESTKEVTDNITEVTSDENNENDNQTEKNESSSGIKDKVKLVKEKGKSFLLKWAFMKLVRNIVIFFRMVVIATIIQSILIQFGVDIFAWVNGNVTSESGYFMNSILKSYKILIYALIAAGVISLIQIVFRFIKWLKDARKRKKLYE